jgi:hypothetical protein
MKTIFSFKRRHLVFVKVWNKIKLLTILSFLLRAFLYDELTWLVILRSISCCGGSCLRNLLFALLLCLLKSPKLLLLLLLLLG